MENEYSILSIGGVRYVNEKDEKEILRLAEEIKRQREVPKYRKGQIVEVSDDNQHWYLRKYVRTWEGGLVVWTDDAAGGSEQGFEYCRDLSWIDKAKIIAPQGMGFWVTINYDGKCCIWKDRPTKFSNSWNAPGIPCCWFQAFPGPCDNWRDLCEEI